MRLSRVALITGLLAATLLYGCGKSPNFVAKDEPWRADEERACLASGVAQRHPFLISRAALGGPANGTVCGALSPFEMTAAAQGRVAMRPAAMLRCPMIPTVDRWVTDVVEPAARQHFHMPIVELKVAASYGCRPMNHQSGAKLSEHGYANALDISEFKLADGRTVTVKSGWSGPPDERQFLRTVHSGACAHFATVLGPNADSFHHDHFHMDLARHGRTGDKTICK
jgi:hypothetical protein